jgi:hypothetical protein
MSLKPCTDQDFLNYTGSDRYGRLDGSGLSDVALSTKRHNAKARKTQKTELVRIVCEVVEEVVEEGFTNLPQ